MDRQSLFYVVQFLDLPFKTIDEYVCVPNSWVILQNSSPQKGNVTYPNNEKPSDTRGRVKRSEKPNDNWRFYPALIKYQSENYKKAKHWISRNSCYESDEEELRIRDTQRKPEQNKKLRREFQPYSSGFNSDKSELTLKTDGSPRKPLPKISMRRLLSQKRDENSNKRLKLNENPKPGIAADHITAVSECSKQKQSIFITGNQVIQKEQIKTSCDSNGKVNTDQNTQSAVVNENRSVKMSIQSISSKLLTEQQLSYQPPTEQQQSQQRPTEQQQSLQPLPDLEPSLESPFERQPSPKLMADQHSSSKLSDDQQPLRAGGDNQQPNGLPEQSSQQCERYQLPIPSVSKNLNSKLQPQESFEKDSVEVTDKQSILRFQNIIDSITSTSHDDSNLIKLSQMLKVEAKKIFSLMKEWINSVDETISHEGNAKNIPTVQHPPNSIRQFDLPNDSTDTQSTKLDQHNLQQAQVDDSRMNNVECMMSQRDPLLQSITNTPSPQNILMLSEQDRPVLETSRKQQNLPTRQDYVQQFVRQQDMLRRPTMTDANELMKRSTDRVLIIDKLVAQKEVNIESAAHNSSSQSHQDAEHPQQEQNQLNYRDPPTRNTQNSLLLRLKRSSDNPKPQRITKRSRSLPLPKTSSQEILDAQKSSFIQELGLQERVNQSSMTCDNINLAAAFENHQSNYDYQHLHMKKTMVAQVAETDSMMDVDHSVEAVAGSTISESASKAVDSARQTDECLRKEQASFYKETASDSENPSEHEIEIENEVVPEANQTILSAGQNVTPENKHVQSEIFVAQDMMDLSSTLFNQMNANLAFARDMFDCLRNSMLTCAQTHETLLKKAVKLNSIGSFQSSTSPLNNVISQVTQERSATENDNATILPVEYDPNNTKWTLKYREKKPGLVELMPQTGIYVKRKELQRCIRESSDCRTLARLLLTEVFSQNALRVCSWTDGKAKAVNSVNIDIRPGLDENARMVLLAFVEEHGKKRGWNTYNTSAVMSTIRTKIKDIRDKHERTYKA